MDETVHELLDRVRALEEQVKLICESTGTPYTLGRPQVPPAVAALIEQGQPIEAVKLYRELTGTDLKTAAGVVAEF